MNENKNRNSPTSNTTAKQRGKFIVIEGGEGAGKSSQLKDLENKLGDKFVFTREPGGTEFAEEIREIILNSKNASQADAKTMFALFWAARADHLKNKIIPALESGKNVLCDRFDSSTYAYQIFGQEVEELKENFFYFRDFFVGEHKPDAYIYLEIDTETGLSRKTAQPDEINHFENRKIEFFNRMKIGFDEFFKLVDSDIYNLDAAPAFAEVNKNLIKIIEKITKN